GWTAAASPSSFFREIHRIEMKFAHEKGPFIGGLANDLGGGLARAVTGAGFDANQDWRGTGLRRLQRGREFEAVRRHDAVIVIAGRNERGRIMRAGLDVV